eukprot:Sro93_g048650.2  (441) ;mRNA; r:96593-97915
MRGDREVINQTISAHEGAATYALHLTAWWLLAEKTFVLEIVSRFPQAMRHVPDQFLEDKDVALAAISQHPLNITYFSENIKDDEIVMLKAIEECKKEQSARTAKRILSTILQHASERLKDERGVMLAAIQQDGMVLRYASNALRQDRQCVMAAASRTPEALKYALGGLNQDQDCLIAAGLWDDQSTINKEEVKTHHEAVEHNSPKIVLSTRFSLSENCTGTATNFAVLLKHHPYISGESRKDNNFVVYSPNAFEKDTCDPKWTSLNWPCRGTCDTCLKEDPTLKTGKPKRGSCWRYSFRYQLQHAKDSNGFMVQVVEFREIKRRKVKRHARTRIERCLGKGQEIETRMANDLGVKIFRIYQPGDYKGTSTYMLGLEFRQEDIDRLVDKVKEWYRGKCLDMTETEIYATDEGATSSEEEEETSEEEIDLLWVKKTWRWRYP